MLPFKTPKVDKTQSGILQEEEGTFAWQVVGSGERDILIMRVNYNGNTPSYCNENCVRDNMWDGDNNVDDMYKQISYGAISFPKVRSRLYSYPCMDRCARAHALPTVTFNMSVMSFTEGLPR